MTSIGLAALLATGVLMFGSVMWMLSAIVHLLRGILEEMHK